MAQEGAGIGKQGYRQRISDVVKVHHPYAEIYNPYALFPNSVVFDDRHARQALFAMAEDAASADVVLAYLPETSMGAALEMIRAYDHGKIILRPTF